VALSVELGSTRAGSAHSVKRVRQHTARRQLTGASCLTPGPPASVPFQPLAGYFRHLEDTARREPHHGGAIFPADLGETAMGKHEKPPADPGTGTPPPGNSDGQVPPPPPSTGKHKK
jgi:hypothetical protein